MSGARQPGEVATRSRSVHGVVGRGIAGDDTGDGARRALTYHKSHKTLEGSQKSGCSIRSVDRSCLALKRTALVFAFVCFLEAGVLVGDIYPMSPSEAVHFSSQIQTMASGFVKSCVKSGLVIDTNERRTQGKMSMLVDVSALPAGSPPPSTPPSPPLASDESLAAAKEPTGLPKRERRSSKEALMAVASRVGKALALPEGAEPAFCD